jgi:uncharacterized protein
MAHGAFYWNELMTNDVEQAKTFFATTVGWEFEGMNMADAGTYWVAKADGKPVGGIMDMTGIVPPGVPPHWMSYLEVDDVDARLAQVASAGGNVIRPPFDIAGVGRIAILADPTGAVMGWMTPVREV